MIPNEPSRPPFPHTAFDVVALATSAGGLDALSHVLGALPADFPAAVVVVQHTAPGHKCHPADILLRRTRLRIKNAEAHDRLTPGTVYLAPPDHHLLLEPDGTLGLARTPKVNFSRPSGDVLFGSVATCCRDRAVAGVLTGSGSNGAAGVRRVKDLGGVVLAQDRATSRFFSMPRAAIATGCVDRVLPLPAIAPALLRLVRDGRSALDGDGHPCDTPPPEPVPDLSGPRGRRPRRPAPVQ
jgi:two-component system chemotaxis response regulator CheB